MSLAAVDLPTLSQLFDTVSPLGDHDREAWFAAMAPEQRRFEQPLRQMLSRESGQGREAADLQLPELGGKPDPGCAGVGERIGPYVLVRELGQGGMGSVWLAERADGSFKRQVALKLPRLTWDRGLAERMARERDIGALLEHPHIARFYDAGVDELGRPYLALEFIDGVPIDVHCDANGLSVPARLRLFIDVARAVAYAHGRLVVHRDLKPSNVLVSADGQVHLLDFGIAKLLLDASVEATATVQGRAMTPGYASPEQVAGEVVTVQSDVYGLGVLLFELLTGRLPFEAGRRAAMEEAILAGGPPLASARVDDKSRARELRGELDAILAKAMRRNPLHRYSTADALAHDIERYLAGETVSARPDSSAYRLRKALRRHWLPLTATAAVLMTATAGAGAALLQSQRAARQAERAQAVTAFVSDLFQASAMPRSVGQAPALLDNGASLIARRFQGQPDIQATLYATVARVYADIGAFERAGEFAERVVTLQRGQVGGSATAGETAQALLLMANAAMGQEEFAKAERLAMQAMSESATQGRLRVDMLVVLARAAFGQGELTRARAALERLEREGGAQEGGSSATAAWVQWLKGEFAANIADILKLQQAGLALMEKAEGASALWVVEMQLVLGRRLLQVNHQEEGKAAYERAIAALRSLGGPTGIRADLAIAELHHVRCYMGQEPHAVSVAALEKVRETLAGLGAVVPADLRADVDIKLASCRVGWAEFDEAQRLLDASAALYLGARPSPRRTFDVEGPRLTILEARGEHDRTVDGIRRFIELRRRMGNAALTFEAGDWIDMARNHIMAGEFVKAEAVLSGMPRFGDLSVDQISGTGYQRWLPVERARLLLAQGQPGAAWAAMPRLLNPEPQNYPVHNAPSVRGEILCAQGQRRQGVALLRESIRELAPYLGPGDPWLARMRAVAGRCALALGQRNEATADAQAARVALAMHSRVSPWFETPVRQLEQALKQRARPVRFDG